MNIRENEILNEAIRQLNDYLGKDGAVSLVGDDSVTILGRRFVYEVKTTVDNTVYNHAVAQLKQMTKNRNDSPLLVCGTVPYEILSAAKNDGINILDASGNCEITPEGGPYLSIRGRKSEYRKQPSNMVFRTAGIKVMYYLLLNPLNIRKSFREIQAATGVSVGTVKNVVDALTPQYCFESSNGRNLTNLTGLLDLWSQGYNQVLKPRLILSRYAFTRGNARDWENIILPDGMNWGGECGAYKLDGYLIPEKYELYTKIPTNALLRTGKVIPSNLGEITVYENFWMKPEKGIHPLVIYADLMGTADGRCREQAQRILNNELSYIK